MPLAAQLSLSERKRAGYFCILSLVRARERIERDYVPRLSTHSDIRPVIYTEESLNSVEDTMCIVLLRSDIERWYGDYEFKSAARCLLRPALLHGAQNKT